MKEVNFAAGAGAKRRRRELVHSLQVPGAAARTYGIQFVQLIFNLSHMRVSQVLKED